MEGGWNGVGRGAVVVVVAQVQEARPHVIAILMAVMMVAAVAEITCVLLAIVMFSSVSSLQLLSGVNRHQINFRNND